MNKKSWFKPYLTKLLKKRCGVLDNWRQQDSTRNRKTTKNFENWLLVELVYQLYRGGKVAQLRTNGFIPDTLKVDCRKVKGLSGGRKKSAKHLSADITVLLKKRNRKVVAEIKTGLSPKEILNDLAIVNYYSTRKDICDQAEFIWIVLLPDKKDGVKAIQSVKKSIGNTYKKMKNQGKATFIFKSIKGTKQWMYGVVAVSK